MHTAKPRRNAPFCLPPPPLVYCPHRPGNELSRPLRNPPPHMLLQGTVREDVLAGDVLPPRAQQNALREEEPRRKAPLTHC